MKKLGFILLLAVVLVSCKQKKSNTEDVTVITEEEHPGKQLMETQCYLCHNPETAHDERIAPPMIAVKKHYKTEGISKEDFKKAIITWLKTPNEETSKMPGAIKKFGVMPYASYSEDVLDKITDYVYDYDIEEPEWFEEHYNEEHGKGKGQGKQKRQRNRKGKVAKKAFDKSGKTIEEIGLHYALSTKKVLGKNLMGTIQKKGTVAALEFCNEKAYPLTDSMSTVFNANIKRVSDKARNLNNKANSKELLHIETFKNMITNGKEAKAITEEVDGNVKFYYPITTNTMCLQCHGKPNDNIKSETYKTLKLLYPNDAATGYDVDQVRGIWSITFKK